MARTIPFDFRPYVPVGEDRWVEVIESYESHLRDSDVADYDDALFWQGASEALFWALAQLLDVPVGLVNEYTKDWR